MVVNGTAVTVPSAEEQCVVGGTRVYQVSDVVLWMVATVLAQIV